MNFSFKLPSLFIIFLLLTACSNNKVRIVHYNIKELNTLKIDDLKNEQILNVQKVLEQHPFDILSLNEIQFDQENIPNKKANTRGMNLTKLKKILDVEEYQETFHRANTGKSAKRNEAGDFYLQANTKESRRHADQVNFGVFPAQYSTGAIFKYDIISAIILNTLTWKKFNPAINLKKYKSAKGLPLPTKMELFDKNFSDVVIDINGHQVHLILLHTVPSYHFGNKKIISCAGGAYRAIF